jgi:hypothetical protein
LGDPGNWDSFVFYEGPEQSSASLSNMYEDIIPPFPPVGAALSLTLDSGESVPVQCQNLNAQPEVEVAPCVGGSSACAPFAEVCVDGSLTCVHTCPSFIYDNDDWNSMWLAYVIPGLFSFCLNAFLLVLLGFMGHHERKKVPFQTQAMFAMGFLFSLVDIVPVSVLYTSLPCHCDDEQYNDTSICQGESTYCAISRLSVFMLVSIFYTIGGIITNLLLTIRRSPHAYNFKSWYFVIFSVIVPLVCAFASIMLDFQPTEDPAAPTADLIIIRDAFSCNPRFSSFVLDFVFVQLQFILSSAICFFASCFILREMLRLSGAAGVRISSKKESSNAIVSGATSIYRKLKSQKADKLVLMAFITVTLLLINLFITVSTAPVLQSFKEATDEWRACSTYFRSYCPGYRTCRSFKSTTCDSHADCLSDWEYCSDQNVCDECFECALRGDGVGGECPQEPCGPSTLMNPKEQCAFEHCAELIADCTKGEACWENGLRLADLLEEGGLACETDSSCDFGPLLNDVSACVRTTNGCQLKDRTCHDPLEDLEGCRCSGTTSPLVLEEKLLVPETGCHVPIIQDEVSGVQGNICIVEDAAKCLEHGVRLFNTKSWMNEEAKFRDSCCYESAPYPRIETVCGDRPEEAPSVLSLSASFFVLSFISCVPGLIFGRSLPFYYAFKTLMSPVLAPIGFISQASTRKSSGASSGNSSAYSKSSGVGSRSGAGSSVSVTPSETGNDGS